MRNKCITEGEYEIDDDFIVDSISKKIYRKQYNNFDDLDYKSNNSTLDKPKKINKKNGNELIKKDIQNNF